jgi:hypothetical protein
MRKIQNTSHNNSATKYSRQARDDAGQLNVSGARVRSADRVRTAAVKSELETWMYSLPRL